MQFDMRKYTLSITGEKIGRPIELSGGADNRYGLDISFNVRFGCTGLCREGTVSITGLSREHINKFIGLSVLSEADAASQKIKLTLHAGYESTGMTKIISGYVVRAKQSPPPELKLTLTVMESYVGVGCERKTFGIGGEGCELFLWLPGYAAMYGLEFRHKDNYFGTHESIFGEKRTLPTKTRTYAEALDSISRIPTTFSWQTCVSDGVLWIYDTDRSEYASSLPTLKISEDTGLLGVSGIDFLDVTFMAFLQDWKRCPILPNVELESTYNAHANGKYFITSVNYVGTFRGTEWYVKFSGQRINK